MMMMMMMMMTTIFGVSTTHVDKHKE